ncbi:MAG: O-antigen ligase family protein, partial [Actinomadura rubrobrunea]|nr:O-antigen ligase family protein [Actinomadura rubrobrunea]
GGARRSGLRRLRAPLARPSTLVAVTVLCVCVPAGRGATDDAVKVTPADLASAAVVAVAAVLVVAARRRLPPRALVAFGPVIVTLGLTTVCSTDIAASLPGAVRFLQIFVLVPLAVTAVVRDRRDLLPICAAVLAAAVFEAGYGIVQVATGTGASYEGRPVRAVGTFGAMDVMALATVVGYGLVVTLAFLLARPSRGRPAAVTALLWAVLAVQAAALVLSLSRGAWIAVGAAAALMTVLRDRMLALRAAVAAGAVAVVAAGALGPGAQTVVERARSITASTSTPDQSVVDRYSLWSAAADIWRDHPVTGIGVKNFAAYRDTYAPIQLSGASDTSDSVNGFVRQELRSPHNQYLLVLSEQGLLGISGFAVLLGVLLVGLARPPAMPGRSARRDAVWLVATGFMKVVLVDFLYGDLGGPTSVLTSVMLGVTAVVALGPSRGPGGPVPRVPETVPAADVASDAASARPRGRRMPGGAHDSR